MSQLDNVNEGIVAVKFAGTKSAKQEAVKNLTQDALDVLVWLLDPMIVSGLSTTKICKKVDLSLGKELPDNILDVLNYLKKNNTGTDTDIATTHLYIKKHPDHEVFLIRLFTKNLPVGMEAKTLNKIVGKELIPTWEVQQGYPIDKYTLRSDEWFSLSQKLNGNRGTYYKGQLISRQGKVFSGLWHITDELRSLNIQPDYVFDGELIRKNTDGISDNENFRIGTGILNSDTEDKSCMEFVIFDAVPVDEFGSDEGTGYYKRRQLLCGLDSIFKQRGFKNIRIVPMVYAGTDQSVISQWLDYAVAHDWEGLMLNRNVPYKRKRHNGCLKIKRFYTMDLPIVAIEEGQNRLAGTLGNLVVDFKGNLVRVGSGFDDETRATVWENQQDYIGKLVEVKYKEVTKDKKTGLESLQFPIFVRFRDDKSEVSYG